VFGFYKGYFHYLQLKGMGFKFMLAKNNVILKIGYNHRVLFLPGLDVLVTFVSKFLLKINTRSLNKLKQNVNSLFKVKKRNSYKKKGIFIKGSIVTLKLSSKKTKF